MRVMIRPMFILKGRVISACSRRVRSRYKSVPVRESVKQERGAVIPINAMRSYHRRSSSGFNIAKVVEPTCGTRVGFLIFLFFINVIRMVRGFSRGATFLKGQICQVHEG